MPRRKSAAALLLGTWRSDRKRTTEQWVFPRRLANAKRKRFEAIFGEMVVRYTRTRHISKCEGRTWTSPYRVLWSGDGLFGQELVLVFKDGDKEAIHHVFFDSPNSYYIHSGMNVEFFKRMRSNISLQADRER